MIKRLPHPRRAFVLAPRVGEHKPKSTSLVSGHDFSRAASRQTRVWPLGPEGFSLLSALYSARCRLPPLKKNLKKQPCLPQKRSIGLRATSPRGTIQWLKSKLLYLKSLSSCWKPQASRFKGSSWNCGTILPYQNRMARQPSLKRPSATSKTKLKQRSYPSRRAYSR